MRSQDCLLSLSGLKIGKHTDIQDSDSLVHATEEIAGKNGPMLDQVW